MTREHILALGCSHTAGVAIQAHEIYVNVLAQKLNMSLVNLAVPGGNHIELASRLVDHLQNNIPNIIVAQWPNPVRTTMWYGNKKTLENISSGSSLFRDLLQASVNNFYEPWMQTIILCNLLCKAKGLTIINILLETVDQCIHQRLEKFNVQLHQDDKQPGRTWFFDSAASDQSHHSARCHQLWAERLLEIINASSPR